MEIFKPLGKKSMFFSDKCIIRPSLYLLPMGNDLKRFICFTISMALPLDVLEKSVNQQLTLLLKDGRLIEGKLSGYDEYMNMVLDDVEETANDNKRRLGTIILRGNNVVSISL
ncbi:MAG: LSM domain-containing protein [Petrotogales bacterium]